MLRTFLALSIVSLGVSAFANTPAQTEEKTTTTTTTTATGASTTLSYKEAKATCLKEKPELKGKELRTCVTAKQVAAKGGAATATTK
jgi:ABC-type glycerol-3-phosphate transport system substrate-binding protein